MPLGDDGLYQSGIVGQAMSVMFDHIGFSVMLIDLGTKAAMTYSAAEYGLPPSHRCQIRSWKECQLAA